MKTRIYVHVLDKLGNDIPVLRVMTVHEIENANNLKIEGDLHLFDCAVSKLPVGMEVKGDLNLEGSLITELPAGLVVGGDLVLNRKINKLPRDLTVNGEIKNRWWGCDTYKDKISNLENHENPFKTFLKSLNGNK